MNRAGKWYIKSCLIKDLMKDNYGEDFWKVKFQKGCWNSVSYSPQKKALTEIYRPFEKKIQSGRKIESINHERLKILFQNEL